MKGNAQVIEVLNEALIDELMAINQYILHSEMYSNWGYKKLGESEKALARVEMKHAEMLVERIVFLEGMPTMTDYRKLNIGSDAKSMIAGDLKSEMEAVDVYRRLTALAWDKADKATADLAQGILVEEEEHVNDQESERDMLEKLGVQIYLGTKV